MGFEYFKRPLRSVLGNSTLDTVTVENGLTLQGTLRVPTQSLTASTALQTLSTEGASFLTLDSSGAGRDFRLPAPVAGLVKLIAVNRATTSPPDLRIVTNTTAQTFFGTTFNQALLADSTAAGARVRALLLVGVSTSQWAVLPNGTTATGWVFSGTTGSTGQ